jgi:competence protein ComEA
VTEQPPRAGQARATRAGAVLAVALAYWVLSARSELRVAGGCEAPEPLGARGALSAVACDGAGAARLAGALPLLFGRPLDLNRADAAALEALPGIGAGRAAAIVRERPFCSVAELDRVEGVGPVTLARVAPFLATPAAAGCAGS